MKHTLYFKRLWNGLSVGKKASRFKNVEKKEIDDSEKLEQALNALATEAEI